MASDNLYWVWLAGRIGVGSKHLLSMIDKFGSPFEIYNASEEELTACECIPADLVERLSNKSLDHAYKIIDYCTLNSIGILSFFDEYYPSRLKSLKDPPAVLYYKGTLENIDSKLCISIVGTRKMSEYGKRTAYKIAYELGSAGAMVVSGMALGIDSVAACGAIEGDGKTIAVLGCGIDVVYPKQHGKLQRIIENNGVVLTEFEPGTRPIGINFPIRNRIISGLSQGTLVVEADEKSGAMITAKNALLQGRELYAVPGNIDESNSLGTNKLIRDGAHTVLSADDILVNYEIVYGKTLNYTALAYAKAHYEYSEEIFDRMGIASRAYKPTGWKESESTSEKSNSRLLPFRKPSAPKADKNAPSTLRDTDKVSTPKVLPKKDGSEEILKNLDDNARLIFAEMPIDRAVSVEKLCALGFVVGDVMSALTILEINGLVSSLPGNLYIKR